MKNPLAAVAYALMFLFSGVAVAEFLVQNDGSQNQPKSPTPVAPKGSPPASPPVPAQPDFIQTSVMTQAAPDDSIHAGRVRTLIKRYLPEASDEVVAVLVEEYAEFDLEGVEFMLQQRQSSGLTIPASLNINLDSLSGGIEHTAAAVSDHAKPGRPVTSPYQYSGTLEQAIRSAAAVARRNLLCESTPGYRRVLVCLDVHHTLSAPLLESPAGCPAAADASPVPPTEFPATELTVANAAPETSASCTISWSWEPGRSVVTGKPLHVSLPDDPQLMFRLSDGRYTRRGDFRILASRQIGIRTSSGTYALADVPEVPEHARHAAITENGTIVLDLQDGTHRALGTVAVCRIQALHQLESDDGVIFRSRDTATPQVVSEPSLTLHSLELSNVDRDAEWRTFEHFDRLQEACATAAASLSF